MQSDSLYYPLKYKNTHISLWMFIWIFLLIWQHILNLFPLVICTANGIISTYIARFIDKKHKSDRHLPK